MKILVLNAGSSTLKFSLIETDGERTLAEGSVERGTQPSFFADAVGQALRQLQQGTPPALGSVAELAAVGHRVVHGGDAYTAAVRIDATAKQTIAALAELAPLHNAINLEGITAAETLLPHVPQVAVFDTAFHATIPPAARTYALPWSWSHDDGLRRYGFHGLSHAYCTGRAVELLRRAPLGLRLVICHLGNGCSASAVRDGRCVDTSMGFTPLDGLMMGTRSGAVDPGLLLHVLRRKGVTAEQLDHVLNHESGLLGVSGVAADMRQVLAAAAAGNDRARLALEIYAHRIRQTVGAMTATLGGVDALVFTAGVGEHAAPIRAMACQGLECLGLELDASANERCRPDADVAAAASRGRILVIGTREDLMIARETVRVLGKKET